MDAQPDTRPRTETVFGIATALTGLGVLGLALFPLALPIVILTGALLIPLLPLAALAALAGAAVLMIRGIGHRVRQGARASRRRAPSTSAVGRASALRRS